MSMPVPRINQRDLLDALAATWWDESGLLHGLGALLDPVRVPFLLDVLRDELGHGTHRVLDVGAGGGLLAETLDGAGFSTVALDPSLLSLRAGKDHGVSAGSPVSHIGGTGEQLPSSDASFDAVICMEVLEHVDDAGAVVGEAGRVLRPGGVFVYSGPNRTVINRVGLLFVAQDLLGVVPRGTHRWDRLLRPGDVERHMRSSGIDPVETFGVGIRAQSLPRAAWAVIGLLTGRLTYPDAAMRVELTSGIGGSVAYQGFGVRR
jgi:2-polyprenyl-6-hydroxyphenyl methylase/3-demethylubiquinone-9 3-methyltransferase